MWTTNNGQASDLFIMVLRLHVVICLHFLHAPQSSARPPVNEKHLLKHSLREVVRLLFFFLKSSPIIPRKWCDCYLILGCFRELPLWSISVRIRNYAPFYCMNYLLKLLEVSCRVCVVCCMRWGLISTCKDELYQDASKVRIIVALWLATKNTQLFFLFYFANLEISLSKSRPRKPRRVLIQVDTQCGKCTEVLYIFWTLD